MDILIKNADIISCDGISKPEKAHIGIKDGIIKLIGKDEEHINGYKVKKVIDGSGKIVMPGLVNAHTHSAMTVLRNFANDLSLEEWLFNNVFPAEAKLMPEDVYWGAMLGITEMIKSGTTAFADMYFYMEEVVKAVLESGIRANLSQSTYKVNGEKLIDETSKCIELYKNWNNRADGRIKVYIEVHSVYLLDEEKLRISADIARELNTGIHIHILETLNEIEESVRKYGMNSIEICCETGIFNVPIIAAHCVHLSENDMNILKQRGVSVAHNPASNLKLGSGIAKVPELMERGIDVCLGTDGAASNNNLNMFEELHLAALIHKGVHRNPLVVNAKDILRMATTNGAKALGFADETGMIKEGMKADIIMIDIDKPHLCPVNDPISAIVYSAQGSDVDTVIVDGRILMEKGELKTIDEEKVKYMVREIAKRVLGE